MIKKLYKKIKIYFINRKIKKIQKEISKLQEQLKWIRNHIHDISWYESLRYVKATNAQLNLYKTELNTYKENKERLMK